MKKFEYYQPQSLNEALEMMERQKEQARYVAGGTDVIVRLKQRALTVDALISLRGIDALRGILEDGSWRLGSMCLFREMERSEALRKAFPSLSQAVAVLANPQVRNVATVGGNLCNAAPSADCAPPLLVLGARLKLEGPGGAREVSIEDFFTGPGQTCKAPSEILTEIRMPKPAKDSRTAFLKIGRVKQDIAVTNAAVMLEMNGGVCRRCRMAVGAVAPVPMRLYETEKLVEGRKPGPDLLEEVAASAAREVRPITDVRSTEEYRRTTAGVLVKRAMGMVLEDRAL